MILTDWHHLFGMTLTDYFTNSAYRVELEKDLSIKKQLLDVVIIAKHEGKTRKTPAELPPAVLGDTQFLRQARADGVKVVNGSQLLVYEAALAFERWTGQTPPYEVMFEAAGQTPTEETTRDTTWTRDWQRLVRF